MNMNRFLVATLVPCAIGLLVVSIAGAVPKPAPKFWSPARCERTMLDRPLAPPAQVICVGVGSWPNCRRTSGHRTRVYAEFTVFTRYRQTNVRGVGMRPGVIRSFKLATRARPGFSRVVSHGGDQYAGWPADFYMSHRRLLATGATPARFRAIVARTAARLTEQETASGCGT